MTVALCLLCALPSAAQAPDVAPIATAHGAYLTHIPDLASARFLVLIHGAVASAEEAPESAARLLARFKPMADQEGFILIAPIFDDANYGSVSGPAGGYRALLGRTLPADAFLDEVIEHALKSRPRARGKFLLYGHSAGAQFALRYSVLHPERVAAVVATSPATFAFPDAKVDWPFGMGRMRARAPWPGMDPPPIVELTPRKQGWADAALVPTTVIVGAKDTMEVYPTPGQRSETRVGRASAWVSAMNGLAATQKKTGKVRLVVLPESGHFSEEMHQRAVRSLLRP